MLGNIFLQSVDQPSVLFIRLTGVFSVLIMTGVCGIMSLIGGEVGAALLGVSPLAGAAIVTLVVALYTSGGGAILDPRRQL